MQKIVDMQHEIAEGHIPELPSVGKVLAPYPDIVIEWNNIKLEKEQIYLNEYWIPGHTRTHKGTISSPHIPGADSFTDEETITDTLKPGDIVSVYPLRGGQLFLVENRVIKL